MFLRILLILSAVAIASSLAESTEVESSNSLKVCVYMIAKNEEHQIGRFWSWAKYADHVLIVDTGSTDRTIQKFRALGAQVLEQKFDPWRFDTARQWALEHVPDDCDIALTGDFDTTLEPLDEWRSRIEVCWNDPIHPNRVLIACYYQPDRNSLHDYDTSWASSPGDFEWRYPVHERLVPKDGVEERVKKCNLAFYQRHYNYNKDRTYYRYLLMKTLDHYDDAPPYHRLYYAWEHWKRAKGMKDEFYGFDTTNMTDSERNDIWRNIIKVLNVWDDPQMLHSWRVHWSSDHTYASNYYKAKAFEMISEAYDGLGETWNAESWALKAVAAYGEKFRDPWAVLAQHYYNVRDYESCAWGASRGLRIPLKELDNDIYRWMRRTQAWTSQLHDLKGQCDWAIGRRDDACRSFANALEWDETSDRFRFNTQLKHCQKFYDHIGRKDLLVRGKHESITADEARAEVDKGTSQNSRKKRAADVSVEDYMKQVRSEL